MGRDPVPAPRSGMDEQNPFPSSASHPALEKDMNLQTAAVPAAQGLVFLHHWGQMGHAVIKSVLQPIIVIAGKLLLLDNKSLSLFWRKKKQQQQQKSSWSQITLLL